MRDTRGHINRATPSGIKFNGGVLAVGRGTSPQVQQHVQHLACKAVHKLGVLMGRQLEVHAPQHALTRNRVILFPPFSSKPQIRKKIMMEYFDESTAAIFKHGAAKFKATW